MSVKHHILLLGGTGICGQIFTRTALDAGHQLTLYLRCPSKLAPDLADHPNLTIIQGELSDLEGLSKAASCGADVFVSLAGPTLGRREGTPITHALQRLYPLLLKANPHIRILLLSTASYAIPEDKRSIKWFFAINGYVKIIGGDSYTEIKGLSEETVKLGEQVDWTLFRVPLLSGKETQQHDLHGDKAQPSTGDDVHDLARPSRNDLNARVHTAYVGDKHGKDGLYLDRGRLATWILGEIEERRWIRLCPTLANA